MKLTLTIHEYENSQLNQNEHYPVYVYMHTSRDVNPECQLLKLTSRADLPLTFTVQFDKYYRDSQINLRIYSHVYVDKMQQMYLGPSGYLQIPLKPAVPVNRPYSMNILDPDGSGSSHSSMAITLTYREMPASLLIRSTTFQEASRQMGLDLAQSRSHYIHMYPSSRPELTNAILVSYQDLNQTLPGYTFALFDTRLPADAVFFQRLLEVSLERVGWTYGDATLKTPQQLVPLLELILVVFPQATPYKKDFFYNKKGQQVSGDYFDYLLPTEAGDCEDKAQMVLRLAEQLQDGTFNDPVLKKLQILANSYVFFMSLVYLDSMGSHMTVIAIPVNKVSLMTTVQWNAANVTSNLPLLYFEGTAFYSGVIGTADAHLGWDAYRKTSLSEAYQDIIVMFTTHFWRRGGTLVEFMPYNPNVKPIKHGVSVAMLEAGIARLMPRPPLSSREAIEVALKDSWPEMAPDYDPDEAVTTTLVDKGQRAVRKHYYRNKSFWQDVDSICRVRKQVLTTKTSVYVVEVNQ